MIRMVKYFVGTKDSEGCLVGKIIRFVNKRMMDYAGIVRAILQADLENNV